jgi:hypothetical protein
MKFFSGFSLMNESYLFENYMDNSEYTICGFSYGAIKAFEDVKNALVDSKRVDMLQLFSPAFFQDKTAKFKRLQLMSYVKNEDLYIRAFMDSCFAPYEKKIVQNRQTTKQELEELLNYEWDLDELKKLVEKGVKIEVYLGEDDKIVNSQKTKEFFMQVATVTYIKKANHFLQID